MRCCLIVDDSPVIREIAAKIIADLGFTTRQAARGAEAVAACIESAPDVILLDWDLPSLEALDVLRGVAELAQERRPKIILCASEYDAQQFTLARAAGAAHHVLKPFDARSLGDIFFAAGLIDRQSAQSPATRHTQRASS